MVNDKIYPDIINEEGHTLRHFSGKVNLYITIICIIFSLLFLYTAQFGNLHSLAQRSLLLMFTMFLVFLFYPLRQKDSIWIKGVDLFLSMLGLLAFLRVFMTEKDLMQRGGQPEFWDLILGGLAIILLIEAIRRTIGWFLPCIILAFIFYAFFGPYFPGLLEHQGLSYRRLIQVLYLTSEGIFTSPIAAVANFVLIYIILGAILQKTGTGKVFIDLSFSLFGRFRGAPAKVAVISSSLFGSISGSAVSNVMATGTITIPLMKSSGFKSHTAGAIESVASTGGQLMPPVMGATAFVMAEVMGVSYLQIVVAAIIPAVLYYVSLLCMVDLEAAKLGIKEVAKEQVPKLGKILKDRGHLLVPILALIFLLGFLKFSPQKSAFWTIIVAMIVPQIRTNTRISFKELILGFKEAAVNVLMVAVVCGGAGIIIGILLYSGLALSLSGLLVELSGGHAVILLILTACASIILGMGLPTTAAYIVLAILVAPALTQLGIDKMAAHLFVFYFGVLSAITPPVAVAAFAGASLARANPISTSVTAFRFGLAGFIIPFMVAYTPTLLIRGTPLEIFIALITSIVGVYGIAAVQQNYLMVRLTPLERGLLLLISLSLIFPEMITDIVGFILFMLIVWRQYVRYRKGNPSIP